MSFVTPESLAEQIAGHLAERIIQGDLKSNERIQEGRVVQELEVSRGPVREALLLLESRHLITILPRRGAIVTELTPERVRSLIGTVRVRTRDWPAPPLQRLRSLCAYGFDTPGMAVGLRFGVHPCLNRSTHNVY